MVGLDELMFDNSLDFLLGQVPTRIQESLEKRFLSITKIFTCYVIVKGRLNAIALNRPQYESTRPRSSI